MNWFFPSMFTPLLGIEQRSLGFNTVFLNLFGGHNLFGGPISVIPRVIYLHYDS